MVASVSGARELTSGQLGIWYAQQLAPDNPVYNLGDCLEICGDLNVDAFEEALRRSLEEADAFRLRFRVEGGEPRQYLDDLAGHAIEVLDLSAQPDPRASAEAWMEADLGRPVSLVGGPLSAHVVFKLSAGCHLWYQRVHHIALVGFSPVHVNGIDSAEFSLRPSGPSARCGWPGPIRYGRGTAIAASVWSAPPAGPRPSTAAGNPCRRAGWTALRTAPAAGWGWVPR